MYVGSSYVLTIIKLHVLKFDPTENHYVLQLEPCTVAPTPQLRRRADELVEILEHHGNCSDTLLVNSLSLDPAVTDKVSKILATKGAQGPLRFKSAVLESELPRSAMSVPIEKIMYSYVLTLGAQVSVSRPGFSRLPSRLFVIHRLL